MNNESMLRESIKDLFYQGIHNTKIVYKYLLFYI